MKALQSLRTLHPSEDWQAFRDGFGWIYGNKAGDTARWVSVLAPRYPDDDGHAQNELYIHRKGGSQEYVMSGPVYSC